MSTLRLLVLTALLPALPVGAEAFEDHVFVATHQFAITGNTTAIDIDPPWNASLDVESISEDAIVRHFFGLHYVVNRATGVIQVIDPAKFETIASFSVGGETSPQDILLIDLDTAYVSRRDACELIRVDPQLGTVSGGIDLCFLADGDGLPEMSMMALDRNHLFVQIQRLNRNDDWTPVAPSYLAVIDTTTDQLVDVDPELPGIQAIELTGTKPSFKMQVESERRRLYVSEPGLIFDTVVGGIEEIDLDTLDSQGFVATETSLNAPEIGPFVMVSADKGYVLTYTDFGALSHLTAFSREDGSLSAQVLNSYGIFESLAFDARTSRLFVPDSPGIHVIDATTDTVLTSSAIASGLTPADLVIARDTTPGESTNLIVEAVDRTGGQLSLAFQAGCDAPDHNIVYGPLADVADYGYSGQVCGIGNSGRFDAFAPAGSVFFLVVATDGSTSDGSYGLSGNSTERPPYLAGASCSFQQDLSRRCD